MINFGFGDRYDPLKAVSFEYWTWKSAFHFSHALILSQSIQKTQTVLWYWHKTLRVFESSWHMERIISQLMFLERLPNSRFFSKASLFVKWKHFKFRIGQKYDDFLLKAVVPRIVHRFFVFFSFFLRQTKIWYGLDELLELVKIIQTAVPVIFPFPSFFTHSRCTRTYCWRVRLRPRTHYAAPEEFENGGFTLKTHQMFSVRTTPEVTKNATITGHFGFVFEENLVMEITQLSWSHRFRKAPFSKCFRPRENENT